jgi:cysteine synthase A
MKAAIATAQQIAEAEKNSFIPQQFENPANPEAHRRTTAEEIWAGTNGSVDILVAGVGTGGTITGTSEVIKSRKPGFKAIAVEPAQSPVLTQTLAGQEVKPGPHKIQGIGAGFVPKVLNLSILEEVVAVEQDEAIDWTSGAKLKAYLSGPFRSCIGVPQTLWPHDRKIKRRLSLPLFPVLASGIFRRHCLRTSLYSYQSRVFNKNL